MSLAARHRPQTFASVAGQPLAAAALSRAAATGKVAPAYLLSGTRGVGKTTIARIFAKALNCIHAPAAEPCNECPQCLHITAGNHVDVNEIDGASNTGVDDVRALKETVGFLPMEGKYKIFIIDEAHMLSKSAFNALLKTLEEPPPNTVFIFATTEAHRFPATIISRCQHYVFKHLPEQSILEHLQKVAQAENLPYEDAALRLVARRAAGSVRDSLSLLDQALAMSGGELTVAAVSDALGLAGPELFARLLEAIAKGDVSQILDVSSGVLHAGVDIGYFVRELGAIWKNLFLISSSGERILPHLGISGEDEKCFLTRTAKSFSLAHLHAAWQLTLECQRTIGQSPEPGAALELLLINIALLPRLLPLGSVTPQQMSTLDQSQTARTPQTQPDSGPSVPSSGGPALAGPAEQNSARTEQQQAGNSSHSWEGFCVFCSEEAAAGRPAPPSALLRGMRCSWQGDKMNISLASDMLRGQLDAARDVFKDALARYCGGQPPDIRLIQGPAAKSPKEMMDQCRSDPGVQLACEVLDGRPVDCEIRPGHN